VIRERVGNEVGNNREGTITIMVVDDDPDVAFVIEKFLRHGSYALKVASSGEECLKLLKGDLPDLILLDIMMPGLNGWEACRRITEDPRTSHIPVLILSVKREEEDVRESVEAGALVHLTKPIDMEKLLNQIELAIEGC